MNTTIRRLAGIVAATVGVAAVIGGGGCFGYQLGSSLPRNVRNIHVPIFQNDSDEPLIEADLTREVISAIQRDATFTVMRPTQPADAELKVTIRGFQLSPVAYKGGRGDHRADTYRLTVTASYTLVHVATGQVLSQHGRVYGQTIVSVAGDMTTSKLAALPAASQELARDIVDKITETWN